MFNNNWLKGAAFLAISIFLLYTTQVDRKETRQSNEKFKNFFSPQKDKQQNNKNTKKSQKRLRIAQIPPLTKSIPPKLYGGIERIVSYLTEELVKRGHEVTLFASNDSITSAKLVANGPQLLQIGEHQDTAPRYKWLLKQVRDNISNFDILHFHYDIYLSNIHEILKDGRKPVTMISVHGLISWAPILAHEFNDIPLVSISNDQRRHIGGKPNWIGTVYHGLPRDLYKFTEKPKHVDGKGPYLAFLGRMHEAKRPDLAIEIALKTGIRLKMASSLFVAGSNEYLKKVNNLIETNKEMVEFVGEINDSQKNEFLGNALAFVFPIDWAEPFGMVMIEAMACGTPVIAKRVGSVPEIVEENVSGITYEKLEEAIEAVEKAKHMKRRLVREAFDHRFSVETMVDAYEEIYYSQLKEKEEEVKKVN